MSETSIITTAANGDALAIRVPSEAAVEQLAFILALTGAHPDDRGDAELIRSRISDAQRHIVRQHLILSLNAEAA